MDSKQDYYLVDSNLKKTYIGCNNPKNEKEDLNVVMPRLGKKFYHEMMLQKKEWNRRGNKHHGKNTDNPSEMTKDSLLFHINNEACQIFSGRLFVFYIKLSFMLEIPLGA
nr:hypothetical protein [uncultured Prevotella sp.]